MDSSPRARSLSSYSLILTRRILWDIWKRILDSRWEPSRSWADSEGNGRSWLQLRGNHLTGEKGGRVKNSIYDDSRTFFAKHTIFWDTLGNLCGKSPTFFFAAQSKGRVNEDPFATFPSGLAPLVVNWVWNGEMALMQFSPIFSHVLC